MKRYKFTIEVETEEKFNSKVLDKIKQNLEEEFIIGNKGGEQKIKVDWRKGFQFVSKPFGAIQYIEGKNKVDIVKKLKSLGIKTKNLSDNLAENRQIIKHKRRKNVNI